MIGHTPEKKVRRFVWSRLSRIGHRLHDRLARFERHEDPYAEEGPPEYWLPKEWPWLERVGRRSIAAMPQPIHDPDWVRPTPKPLYWEPAATNEKRRMEQQIVWGAEPPTEHDEP